MKTKVKNSGHSRMILISKTIPCAEGDWDICLRVDFLLSSKLTSHRTRQMEAEGEKGRPLREASQNLQSAEQGVRRHLSRLVSKFKKKKKEKRSIFHLQSANVVQQPSKVSVSYLVCSNLSEIFQHNTCPLMFSTDCQAGHQIVKKKQHLWTFGHLLECPVFVFVCR